MHPALYKIINRILGRQPLCENNKRLSGNNILNILIITPYAPYPVYTGGASRIFEKIKFFGARHNLTVASLYNTIEQKKGLIKTLTPHTVELIMVEKKKPYLSIQEKIPDKILQLTIKQMYKTLKKYAGSFDVIMFEHIYTACYRKIFKRGIKILEEHNIESIIEYQNMELKKTGLSNESNTDEIKTFADQISLLEEFEINNWPLFDLRTTVSEVDKISMQNRCNGDILVIENGVDIDFFSPVEYADTPNILFMGHLGYSPNINSIIYFINEIFPHVLNLDPTLKLIIAGSNPTEEILVYKKHKSIRLIIDPQNMNEVAKNCFITIVPTLVGGGTRIKILQSMAMGLPVVSTKLGCEGLRVIHDEHLIITDEPERFAASIIAIKNDKKLRNKLRINGRLLVKNYYNIKKIYSNYESLLLKSVNYYES